jgi:hypothetical protein
MGKIVSRKFTFLSVALAEGLAVAIGLGFWRNSRIAGRFDRVVPGTSDKEIEQILGKPSWIEPCGRSFGIEPLSTAQRAFATVSDIRRVPTFER